VWNVRTRKLAHRLAVPSTTGAIRNVAIDPLGKRVAGSSWGGTALIWERSERQAPPGLRTPTAIRDMSFSPNGMLFAVAGDANSAKIWDVRTWKKAAELRGHTGGINTIKFSRDGRLVVTASDDGTVRVWTTKSGETRAEFWDGRAGRALDASFDSSGRRIVVAGSDGSSEIYVCGLCGGIKELLRYAEEHAPFGVSRSL
jgi:WD40 repeat protein